jgi:hypothetical protein
MMLTLDPITIKCNSHRARHKLYDLYPFLQGHAYFSWDRKGEFYKISVLKADKALEITGISKSLDKGDLHRCMNL